MIWYIQRRHMLRSEIIGLAPSSPRLGELASFVQLCLHQWRSFVELEWRGKNIHPRFFTCWPNLKDESLDVQIIPSLSPPSDETAVLRMGRMSTRLSTPSTPLEIYQFLQPCLLKFMLDYNDFSLIAPSQPLRQLQSKMASIYIFSSWWSSTLWISS